ncbi:MAG: hydroxyethylthiazole kinase [Tatlockia sp.]|nr:hydroxyethylthiazole kinase [Tatlockia sp.]
MQKELESQVSSLRQIKPLVLCLTNFVTMDLVANSLYALGASPLMSQSRDELEELVSISQAAYINIGTLDHDFCERALLTVQLAKSQNKPVILDPVGAGASRLRTEAAKALLPFVSIVRANASEILALADNRRETKGVEATHSVNQAASAAKSWAASTTKIAVVSGPVDLVTDGNQALNLPYGSYLMPLITGMGCTLSAVIAAFAALNPNPFQAAFMATAYFGLCGQQTDRQTQELGSFKEFFINALFKPDWELFKEWIDAADKVSPNQNWIKS